MHNDSKFSVEVSFLSAVVAAVERMNEEFIEQQKQIIMMDIELKSFFISLDYETFEGMGKRLRRLLEWNVAFSI